MKTFILSSRLVMPGLLAMMLLWAGCKKDEEKPDPVAPAVSTGSAGSILVSGAVCSGAVSDKGGSDQTISAKGIQFSTLMAISESDPKVPGIGPESEFSATLSGLSASTQYYYRAYATNTAGKTGYGEVKSFTTISHPSATLSTVSVQDVYLNKNAEFYQAKATGNIVNLNGGVLVKKGFVWSSTDQNPTLSAKEGLEELSDGAIGSFTITLTTLPRLKTVYIRAFATTRFSGNEVTGYGDAQSIETFVKDVDNNRYNLVKIGNRIWMKENLRTTKYRTGASIPTDLTESQWASNTSLGAYAVYNNDTANNTTYGKLYNWYAIADDRNVCPAGWYVPGYPELGLLQIDLGGVNEAGGKMKAVSGLWNPPNTGATDESGFSSLPAGIRDTFGYFGMGNFCYFWSGSEATSQSATFLLLKNTEEKSEFFPMPKYVGLSVRCVKE